MVIISLSNIKYSMLLVKRYLLLLAICAVLQSYGQAPQTFTTGNKSFLLNGRPFLIRAAELHYPRIPRAYWEHRIQTCKAMGMNTICIYLFWNLHEQKEGVYDFKGQNDILEFVKLVQKNGMYCIVRPGPYVCAEWDMGGLPWWLLKKKDIKVRTIEDLYFMTSMKRFLGKAAHLLEPLQIQNGGNIIMVQVENEYGVWGSDVRYMAAIRDHLKASGFSKVQLFRCDWSSNFNSYNLEGVASTLNFGAGANIDAQFKKFRELNPTAPLMCSEYWTGWFDAWGNPHQTRNVSSFIGSLKDMMDRNISFSLYMAHGGSSFGQWAGANAPPYAPDVSSYDYNAPIDEGGNATEKFYAIRNLLKNYLNPGEKLAAIPTMPTQTISIPKISFTKTAGLFDNLPKPKFSDKIRPMEFFDQGWGKILYRTSISASKNKRKLVITDVHDWAAVYIDKKFIGKIDRRIKGNTLVLPAVARNAQLDILIETTGRVNFGEAIIDRKGITQKVELADDNGIQELKHWQVYNIPVDYPFQKNKSYSAAKPAGPAWYKTVFNLDKTGDTYLDMSTWGKGMVWVNGYNLGRFWNIGPVQTLYLPGCWLKKGPNEIIVMDVERPALSMVKGLKAPILDQIKLDLSLLHRKPGQQLNLAGAQPAKQGSIEPGQGWKEIKLDKTYTGRYFCFEALSAQEPGDAVTTIAEIEIIGENGKPVSTLNWSLDYADSEELQSAQSAEKIFDNQESLIWQSQKTSHPHSVVVDMGTNVKVIGFRILPRGDKSKVGMVKDYAFYLQEKPFHY